MCGIAGYVGIGGSTERMALTYGLGLGIDNRGGHAAGFVGKAGNQVRMARRVGTWDESSPRFLETAAACDSLVMHARYATCGQKGNVLHAHPFTVRTGRRATIYGVHNGMVWGAEESAKRHGRDYTVDSRELLHLVAEGRTDEIQRLNGYGVLAWMVPRSNVVHLVKLTTSGDLEVAEVEGGGHVYGSTRRIVEDGLDIAGLEVKAWYEQLKVGVVHHLTASNLSATPVKGIHLQSGYGGGWSSYYGGRDTYNFNNASLEAWEAEQDAKELAESERRFRIASSIISSNGPDVDVEDKEDYSDAIIESAWDPRWEEAFRRVSSR